MLERFLAVLTVVTVGTGSTNAQTRSTPSEPAFEVASVKPSLKDDGPEGISVRPDGSAVFTRFSLQTLITIAYRSEGIQRFDQLVGGPSWIAVERFDITAKAEAASGLQGGQERLAGMLRSLLRDRFRLRIHTETRSMPAYRLVVVRPDGRLGPRLRESAIECSERTDAPNKSDPDRWCGIRAVGGIITGRAVSAAQLAGNLSGYPSVDRFVTDRTGLTGRYDFTLEYSPGFSEPGGAVAATGPSLFTALTEQLGLRLQPETVMVPVLVIENVETPSPN
jgi:uncharacterized protein (TIGR03435 family)